MRRLLVWLLRAYKGWISPCLPSACRFHPTCSVYAREAVERYGVAKGLWLALKRLARCHPFHPGGFDPVPEASPERTGHAPQAEQEERLAANGRQSAAEFPYSGGSEDAADSWNSPRPTA